MATVRAVPALRTAISAWKRQGFTVGFVPTMGALHEGHLTLVREAARRADRVVASVFVNPTQFAAHEDQGAYPRNEARDAELLGGAGCAGRYCDTGLGWGFSTLNTAPRGAAGGPR